MDRANRVTFDLQGVDSLDVEIFYSEPLLSRQEERELFRAYRAAQSERVREQVGDRLFRANTRLVRKWAHHYWIATGRKIAASMGEDDLVQEGMIGLMRAIKRYDPDREGQEHFSTYGSFWIRQAIERAMSDQGATIRIPVYQGARRRKEIRENLPFSHRLPVAISLDKPTDPWSAHPEETSLLHILASRRAGDESAEETVEWLDTYPALYESWAQLDAREREILTLRFGLRDGREQTLAEIGRGMGRSRELARQIEARALTKLRLALEQRADGEVILRAISEHRMHLVKSAHAHARPPSKIAPILSPLSPLSPRSSLLTTPGEQAGKRASA